MIKVCFVCHGNICRSPMAEYLFRDYVQKQGYGDKFYIQSAATSTEEIGNSVHPGTKRVLRGLGIDSSDHRARQLCWRDYKEYDYFIGMDSWNIKNMMRMLKNDPDGKVYKFLSFGSDGRDIADPWYTGNFDVTYRDVMEGCETFFNYLLENNLIY